MSSSSLIEAVDICKRYPGESTSKAKLKAFFSILFRNRLSSANTTTVIEPLSISIRKGQSLGIIGENGAGKSTLLKMLSGVVQPSEGKIKKYGTVAAILELSAGFDMQRTGLENIYHKCRLLGLSDTETQRLEPAIIAFADIGEHIHKPLKNYSSGMVVRLGFAIISHYQPDLLITDEVLAVGDEAFQRKCVAWLGNYLESGGTLLMVSHSPFQINRLCQECIWIKDGCCYMQGPSEQITKAYTDWVDATTGQKMSRQEGGESDAKGTYRVVNYELLNENKELGGSIAIGEALTINLTIFTPDGRKPTPCIGLMRVDGVPIFGTTNRHSPETGTYNPDKQLWTFSITLPNLALLPGRYVIRVHSMDPEEIMLCDSHEREISVTGSSIILGLVDMPHQWK